MNRIIRLLPVLLVTASMGCSGGFFGSNADAVRQKCGMYCRNAGCLNEPPNNTPYWRCVDEWKRDRSANQSLTQYLVGYTSPCPVGAEGAGSQRNPCPTRRRVVCEVPEHLGIVEFGRARQMCHDIESRCFRRHLPRELQNQAVIRLDDHDTTSYLSCIRNAGVRLTAYATR
jgi:hypothetical protein